MSKEETIKLERILDELASNNSSTRQKAAESLGEIENDKAVFALLDLLEDSDIDVRKVAAKSLGNLADVRAVEPLLTIAINKEDKNWVRAAAVRALGKIGDVKPISSFASILVDLDEPWEVRDRIVEALKRIGNPAIPVLTKLLEEITDPETAKWISSILETNPDIRSVSSLIEILKDEDWDTRGNASRALIKIGSDAVPELIEALKNESDDIRWEVTSILDTIADTRAVIPLIQNIKDRNRNVRRFTASALGNIGSTEVIKPLLELLDDSDIDVQIIAAFHLGKLGKTEGINRLFRLYGSMIFKSKHYLPVRETTSQIDRIMLQKPEWYLKDIGEKIVNLGFIVFPHILTKYKQPSVNFLSYEDKDYLLDFAYSIIEEALLPILKLIKESSWKINENNNDELEKLVVSNILPMVKTLENQYLDIAKEFAEEKENFDQFDITNELYFGLEDIYALGSIGDPKGLPYLLKVINSEESYDAAISFFQIILTIIKPLFNFEGEYIEEFRRNFFNLLDNLLEEDVLHKIDKIVQRKEINLKYVIIMILRIILSDF